jgi:hypothetical protein
MQKISNPTKSQKRYSKGLWTKGWIDFIDLNLIFQYNADRYCIRSENQIIVRRGKMKQSFSFFMIVLFLCFFMLLGYSRVGQGIEIQKDKKIEQYELEKSVNDCGELEFDKTTGGMIRRPNVDLVVVKIEITRNDRGVWVIPWIKNRCPGSITQDIHVSIGDVVVTFAGLTPQMATPLGYSVGVGSATSYTVIVDYDKRIPETNELNNSCSRATTGDCP